MVPDRDTLLKDLKDHVIEVFYNNGMKETRLTLRNDLLPKAFLNDPEQLEEMDKYHTRFPKYIGALNMSTGLWVYIDVNWIKYTQIIDGY